MTKLKALVCTLGLAGMMLGGCGKADAISDMEKMADDICACKDAKCAEEIMKKGDELKNKHKDFEPSKLGEADQKRFAAVTTKLMGCMTKLSEGAGAAADDTAAPAGGDEEKGGE